MEKEKLMMKIQKAEYKISKHQKRITSGLSTWVKHVILCLAFQVQFTWTVTGNRVWRCSDYFLFLGCYLVLCALGWLQLFLSGHYYIQSVMKCDRSWRERGDLEGRLAALKGSSRIQDFDDGYQCQIVSGIMALLYVASCMLAILILFWRLLERKNLVPPILQQVNLVTMLRSPQHHICSPSMREEGTCKKTL